MNDQDPVYSIEFTGLNELVERLNEATKDSVFKESLWQGGLHIAGWSKDKRLTGPRPEYLGIRSGRLRSSITASRAEKQGDAYISKVGTNVEYARIHEFGFFGRIQVSAHVRRRNERFRFKRWKQTGVGSLVVKETTRSGTRKTGMIFVRPFTRNVNMPARPFLRPSIENPDNQKEIINILKDNINEALK